MTTPKHVLITNTNLQTGTAAPSFHLSDTLDWSCLFAQIKNRKVLVTVHMQMTTEDKPLIPHVSTRWTHNFYK